MAKNYMKKITIVLLLFLLAFSSCNETNNIIGLKKGDKRVTITEHYIYVEECTGRNGFDMAFWKYEKIISKDSINFLDTLYTYEKKNYKPCDR